MYFCYLVSKQKLGIIAIMAILAVGITSSFPADVDAAPINFLQMQTDIAQNTAAIALTQLTAYTNQGLLIILQSDNITNKADIATLQNSDILALDLSPADTFTATIDKTNYATGESMYISGKVDADMRGFDVYMGFLNSNGESYGTYTTYVLLDYTFGYMIHDHLLDSLPRGDYTITIGSYHDNEGNDSVTIPITFS